MPPRWTIDAVRYYPGRLSDYVWRLAVMDGERCRELAKQWNGERQRALYHIIERGGA